MYEIAAQLLDWPFLAFVFLAGSGFYFRKVIAARLSGGSITVSWGDKRIQLGELAGAAEGSIEYIQKQLDDLSSEIESFRAGGRVGGSGGSSGTASGPAKTGELTEYQKRRVDRALDDPRYNARSMTRLAEIADITEPELRKALSHDPEIRVFTGEVQGQKTEVVRRKR